MNVVKGALLVLFAVLIGVVVLARGLDAPDSNQGANVQTSAQSTTTQATETTNAAQPAPVSPPVSVTQPTTTTIPPPPPPPTPLPRDRAQVRVQVANSTNACGAAGALTRKLSAAGFNTLGAINASPEREASFAYYTEGYEVDAQVVAGEAPLDFANIRPMPNELISEDVDDPHVLVVIGNDDLAQDSCGSG